MDETQHETPNTDSFSNSPVNIVFPTKPDFSYDFSADEQCDIEAILTILKCGVLISFQRKDDEKYEDKLLCLNEQEFKISWFALVDSIHKTEEGHILIEEIKEIQCGVSKKCLMSDDSNIGAPGFSLRFIYGNTFNLKVLPCFTYDETVKNNLVNALKHLKRKNLHASHIELIERWLRREWAAMKKKHDGKISLKEFRTFLLKANIKLENKKIYAIFESVSNEKDVIDAIQFNQTYNKLVDHPEMSKKYQYIIRKTTDDEYDFELPEEKEMIITAVDLQKFLIKEQHDQKAQDMEYVYRIMRDIKYSGSDQSESVPDAIEMGEFFNYMFHARNSIFKDEHREVYQDMTKPLSQYWIASSYNTYLTDDQLLTPPSVDAYVKVLRKGCRSIELNCWNGPYNEPVVHHGLTLSEGIQLSVVIKAIAENAFFTSDYPLILSILNHCDIRQQFVMAELLRMYLGKYLLTEFLKAKETKLPSPEALKHRIIIHHRRFKIENVSGDQSSRNSSPSSNVENTLFLQSYKPDIMYMTTKYDKWEKHTVVLSGNTMQLSDPPINYVFKEHADEEPISTEEEVETIDKSVMHFGQVWYHDTIDRNRAERLLVDHNRGDGSFLVRPSHTYATGYSLTFWWKNHVRHIHIKTKVFSNGTTRFHVVRQTFDSLFSFIDYYRHNALKTDKFQLILKEPIPEPEPHIDKDWYHENLTKDDVERVLQNVALDGYYLVRKRIPNYSYEPESYILSFTCGDEVKHCRIVRNENTFEIGSDKFSALTELVEHYKRRSIYNRTRLIYPCTRSVMNQPMQLATRKKMVACRAKYSYRPRKDDELFFKKGDLILNISRFHGFWWLGDVNGQTRKWFPVHFTEITTIQEEELENPYAIIPEMNEKELVEDGIESEEKRIVLDLNECNPIIVSPKIDRPFLFRWDNISDKMEKQSVSYEFEHIEDLTCIDSIPTRKSECDEYSDAKYLAKELCDLLVYCRSTPFSEQSYKSGKHYEMSTFSELEMEKLVCRSLFDKKMYKYHERQLSKVCPKSNRFDSSNYDPTPFWNFGTQMCAVNYHTPDKYMQVERGMFLDNGGCGYVLQPKIFKDNKFNPFNSNTFQSVEPLNISLFIMGARHLPKLEQGVICPYIEVEVIGLDCDKQTFRTTTVMENGLCPIWYREAYDFDVACPPLTKILFLVKHENAFGEGIVIAQACFPFTSLRTGHRSVPLKNIFDEDIPLAAIFVELHIKNALDAHNKRMQNLPEREFTDIEYRSLFLSRLQQDEERRRRQTTTPLRRRNTFGGRL